MTSPRPAESATTAEPQERLARARGIGFWVGWAVLGLTLLIAAEFYLQHQTQFAIDSHSLMQIAYRARVLGESYYVAGADLKGPLWIAPYDLAQRLGNFDTAWWFVAAILIAVSCTTGLFVYKIGARGGASRWGAAAAAAALTMWLLFSTEEYSFSLYSRNWLSLLFAGCFAALFTLPGASRRRQLGLAALAGACAGVAVQTNASSATSALLAFGLVVWLSLRGRALRDRVGPFPVLIAVFAGAAAIAFASVFGWYAIHGDLGEFWSYWWTYSRDYANGPGLPWPKVFEKGYNDFAAYYRARPIIPLAVAVFACDAVRRRRAGEPIWMDVTLLLWFVSELVVVTVSQRFWMHYLILPLVPAGAMAAVFAARWAGRLSLRTQHLLPLALGFCALYFGGWANAGFGLDRARDFQSVSTTLQLDHQTIAPDKQAVRQNVLRFAKAGSWAIVWTVTPFEYNEFNLRSATRYVPRVWLSGEMPGAAADPASVPPRWWHRFWQDLRQTPPALLVYRLDSPPPADGVFGHFLRCAFRERWTDQGWTIRQRIKPVDACLAPKRA